MKIIYALGFDTSGYSGKSRASRQKMNALKKNNPDTVTLSLSRPISLISIIILEFKLLHAIFTKRPDIVITRGYVGFLSILLCRLYGISFSREVHADAVQESALLKKSEITIFVLKLIARFFLIIELKSSVLIFNHPDLERWYKKQYKYTGYSFYSYNGFAFDETLSFDKNSTRAKYGFNDNDIILCFVGSASKWHGVEYLDAIASKLYDLDSDIKIVCGGASVKALVSADSKVINLTPFSSDECAALISISHLCLLPVANNRVSPGSPLKLYDYISYKKPVAAQINTNGYADELQKYGNGLLVDFSDSEGASRLILEYLNEKPSPKDVDISMFSWESRMNVWLENFESYQSCQKSD